MILYVAGPMTGLPDFNYPEFRRVAALLTDAGYDVLNPVDAENDNPTPGEPQSWEWYMRRALAMVVCADGIALLDNWRMSRGARLEVRVAEALGMERYTVDTWLTKPAPSGAPS